MKTETINREALINAIWKARGKVALVAEQFSVSTQTIYNYAKRYATVQEALTDSQQHMSALIVDTAETKVFQGVISGERWAVLQVLNNHLEARRRGWGGTQYNKLTSKDFSNMTDDELLAIINE